MWILALLLFCSTAQAEMNVIWSGHSAYEKNILITESGGVRDLWFGTVWQGTEWVNDPNDVRWRYIYNLRCLQPVKTALMIGLGTGSLVKDWLWGKVPARDLEMIDVVEIDPVVIDLAHQWFGMHADPRLHLFTADGVAFLKDHTHRYDTVIVDAYTGEDEVPPAIRSVPFLTDVREALNPNGIAAFNVLNRDQHAAVKAEITPMFPHVCEREQLLFASYGNLNGCCP